MYQYATLYALSHIIITDPRHKDPDVTQPKIISYFNDLTLISVLNLRNSTWRPVNYNNLARSLHPFQVRCVRMFFWALKSRLFQPYVRSRISVNSCPWFAWVKGHTWILDPWCFFFKDLDPILFQPVGNDPILTTLPQKNNILHHHPPQKKMKVFFQDEEIPRINQSDLQVNAAIRFFLGVGTRIFQVVQPTTDVYSSEQWKKHWLVRLYRGLYYPVI